MLFTYDRVQSLNDSELEVYHCILDLEGKVLDMKIRELAELAHVSVTVVWNFCKKMECDGWTEFKFKYKESFQNVKANYQLNEDKSALEYMPSYDESKEKKEQINKASMMLSRARKIVFIGEGTSGVMAKYGAMYLTSVGKSAQYTDTPFYPIPPEDHSDAVVIGLSVSGETISLLDRVSLFKELGATIITITNGSKNKLAEIADIPLSYEVPRQELHMLGPRKIAIRINTTTQIPVMYLIELLSKKCVEIMRLNE